MDRWTLKYGTRLKKIPVRSVSQRCMILAVESGGGGKWGWWWGGRVGRLEKRTSHGRWSTLRWPRDLILKGQWIFSASNFNTLSTTCFILSTAISDRWCNFGVRLLKGFIPCGDLRTKMRAQEWSMFEERVRFWGIKERRKALGKRAFLFLQCANVYKYCLIDIFVTVEGVLIMNKK